LKQHEFIFYLFASFIPFKETKTNLCQSFKTFFVTDASIVK
jgi:hypothetical protein